MPNTAGETTVPIGDWTTGTLKVYEDEKIANLKILMDERKEHLKELRVADQRAIDAALVSQEKAIVKAENAAERRFELLNELRDGVATKDQMEALEKVVDDLKDRINTTLGQSRGLKDGWAYLLGGLGGVATIIGVILAFNN